MAATSNAPHDCPLVKLTIESAASLQASYMPFVENGGLFMPGSASHPIGAEIFVMLRLPDCEDWLPLVGRVIWKTPANAQGNLKSGVGVQFVNRNAGAAEKIQQMLLESDHGHESNASDSNAPSKDPGENSDKGPYKEPSLTL